MLKATNYLGSEFQIEHTGGRTDFQGLTNFRDLRVFAVIPAKRLSE
jgi:hypothetical protein